MTFKRRGLPFGSGAVESTIRRVVNLRLKSNATYWLEENAEAIFAIRAALLSDRWELMLEAVQQSMARDARLTWQWSAPSMKTDAPANLLPPSSQLPSQQEFGDLVV